MKSSRNRITLSLATLACSALLLFPSTASAWVDAAALGQRLVIIAQNVQSLVLGNSIYIKEYFLDYIQKGIAVNIKNAMIESTLNWARAGFHGQPSFVVNPREYLLGAAENEAEIFAEQFTNNVNGLINDVCSPYRITIARAIADERLNRADSYRNDRNEALRLTECSLDVVVTSGVIENYYAPEGFEREGGYAPLIRVMSSRKNNPYEAPLIPRELMAARQQKAIAEAQSKSSGGTLPNEQCAIPGPNGSCLRSITLSPASTVSDLVSKAVGNSFDDLAGQDELSETIYTAIITGLTNRVLNSGI